MMTPEIMFGMQIKRLNARTSTHVPLDSLEGVLLRQAKEAGWQLKMATKVLMIAVDRMSVPMAKSTMLNQRLLVVKTRR